MWALYQISGCLIITIINSIYKHYGLNIKTWILGVLFMALVGWLMGKSYEMAPTFFQAWFLGNNTLILSGFLLSFFVFNDVIIMKHYIGLLLAVVAGYLLIT